MSTFAVINSGQVVNIIVANSKEVAEEVTGMICVSSNSAGVGYTYDAETGIFSAPQAEVAEEVLPPEDTV